MKRIMTLPDGVRQLRAHAPVMQYVLSQMRHPEGHVPGFILRCSQLFGSLDGSVQKFKEHKRVTTRRQITPRQCLHHCHKGFGVIGISRGLCGSQNIPQFSIEIL